LFLKIEPSFGALQSSLSVKHARRDGNDRSSDASNNAGKNSQIDITMLQGSPEVLRRADNFQKQTAAFETSELRSQTAISSYQSIAKEQQRGEIKLLMGVDTYV
jgi:hypothetical protein